jgi:hypothetical protein
MKTIENTRDEVVKPGAGQKVNPTPHFFKLQANNLKNSGCLFFILPHCRAPQPRTFPKVWLKTSLPRLFLLSEQ